MSQERSLESIFAAVVIVVLLLASPVIGIELGVFSGLPCDDRSKREEPMNSENDDQFQVDP